MATTFVEYTGDGNATKQFTFPSYQSSDVKVRVDGDLKDTGVHYNITNYTTTGGGNVVFTSGNIPSSPAKIRIYRDTNVDAAKATYTAGSSVKAGDLNNNQTQLLYRAQEEQVPNLIQSYDLAASAIETSNIKDASITTAKIADSSVTTAKIADNNVTTAKIADNAVTMAKLNSGALPTDITVASANIVDGTIVEADMANSAITANKIADGTVGTLELANGAVTTDKIGADAVTNAKIADNAVASANISDGNITTTKIADDAVRANHIADSQVLNAAIADNAVSSAKIADGNVTTTKVADDAIRANHIADAQVLNAAIASDAVTIDKIADAAIVTNSEQASHTVNDTTFFTTAASEARYFNVSSGETIKDGDTFPDNDTTIATTAAINDRIIDIVNDVGGFDIVESEQHFPDTNPQGQAGSAAVLSIKAATANLVPSGTTLTIVNGNLADNANITITGVTSTIPSGFGFIVESTNTLHTYTFHRLVPKATEVTTVAGKATEIGRLGTAAAVEDMSILGTTDVVADLAILGTTDVVADMNALAVTDVINDMNTLAVTDVISDMDVVATNVTNVNNVGNNVTNVNSVSNSAGANQTFTVTVQDVSGNKYFIDGVQTPVLKLARGKTYTFDMSDSSNSGHPLAFRDSSDNSYTTGVTTSGTAGSSGATVVIVVAANAPSSLKYYCTSHGNAMGNTITVIDDNVGIVAGSISNVNTVGGAISNVNTTAGSISNVNTVASNISNVNSFFNVYRIGANNPTTSLDTGDLFFNTTSNSLKVYTGSAWVDGVTATGNFAVVTGNTFTGENKYNDQVLLKLGTGDDLQLKHTGVFSLIQNHTGELKIAANQLRLVNKDTDETYLAANDNGAVDLYYDNSKKFETTSTGIKVTGVGVIDNTSSTSDTGLRINHSSASAFTTSENLQGTTNIKLTPLVLRNGVNAANAEAYLGFDSGSSNKAQWSIGIRKTSALSGDFIFNTRTGSATSAQRLKITHAGNLQIPNDTGKLQLGASQDLELYHDGSSSYIDHVGTGNLLIRGNNTNAISLKPVQSKNSLICHANAQVQLYHNNDKKFETTSTGVEVDGTLVVTSDYPTINLIDTNNNDFRIQNRNGVLSFVDVDNSDVVRFAIDSSNAKNSMAGTLAVGKLELADNVQTTFGNNDDLSIFHDGTNSHVKNDTNALILRSDALRLNNNGNTATMIKADAGGAVELYYNNALRLSTTANGVTLGHNLFLDNATNAGRDLTWDPANDQLQWKDNTKASFGSGSDLQIFHDGSNTTIDNNTGTFVIRSDGGGLKLLSESNIILRDNDDTTNLIRCLNGGQVELYHAGTEKLETASYGVQVFGELRSTGNMRIISSYPRFYLTDTDNNDDYSLINNNGQFVIYNDTQNDSRLKIEGTTAQCTMTVRPTVDSTYNLGTNTIRWANVYADTYYGNGANLTGINTDLVSDTSPQLGGNLASNGNDINFADNDVAHFGTGQDLAIYHNGTSGYIDSPNNDTLFIRNGTSGGKIKIQGNSGEESIIATHNGMVELYYDNTAKAATASHGMYYNEAYLHHHVNSGNSSEIRFTTNGTRRGSVYADNGNTVGFTTPAGSWSARWHSDGKQTSHGHIHPNATNTYDLGSTSLRWRNVYTNDLHLSNEGSSNDMDGTWGDWTIQEGESDLFLKNNRSGKKYKFNLMEVS